VNAESARAAERSHAPALGAAHKLLGRFHVTGVFWYRLHYFSAVHTPAWLQRIVTVTFTAGFLACMPRIRNAVASNLEPVLGPTGRVGRWKRAHRTFSQFAYCLTERYQRTAYPERFTVEIDGLEHWQSATGHGSGAVIATAHLGPWETSIYAAARLEKRVAHVVREEEIDPRAQEFIQSIIIGKNDAIVTHYASEDPRLAIELSEALRRGELVALQSDRPRGGGRTVTVSIFGKPFPLPIGPAALARASGVPLLPVFSFRDSPRVCHAVARPPIVVPRTANRDEDLKQALTQLGREIEWAITQRPYQWFCFRKLW
jgi:KDO2-lipid IV(A) lauroyltransferase